MKKKAYNLFFTLCYCVLSCLCYRLKPDPSRVWSLLFDSKTRRVTKHTSSLLSLNRFCHQTLDLQQETPSLSWQSSHVFTWFIIWKMIRDEEGRINSKVGDRNVYNMPSVRMTRDAATRDVNKELNRHSPPDTRDERSVWWQMMVVNKKRYQKKNVSEAMKKQCDEESIFWCLTDDS